MAEYLMILSYGIIQIFEVGFCFPFQPELLIDESRSFLAVSGPILPEPSGDALSMSHASFIL